VGLGIAVQQKKRGLARAQAVARPDEDAVGVDLIEGAAIVFS
jgi:hypothetical protein